MRVDVAGNLEFSILLPTHNRADVLPFAIRSVLAQTVRNFELLIVGDGCTDGTAEVVQSFNDARIVWLDLPKAPNMGYANRNIALRQARGTYIAFMAHDDLWFPDHLELLLPLLQKPGIELGYSHPLWVIPKGKLAPLMFSLDHVRTLKLFLSKKKNRIPASCVIHRRECVSKYGDWNDSLPRGADWDMWIRIIEGGKQQNFVSLSEPTCLHFRANWRTAILDDEAVWERLHSMDGFLPASLQIPITAGMTEQEAAWRAMSAEPRRWAEGVRRAIREAYDLRISQSDELMAWLLKRQPDLPGDITDMIAVFEGLFERQAAFETKTSTPDDRVAQLRAQLNERQRELQDHAAQVAELAEIKSSRAWRAALILRGIRGWLVPPASRRERILRGLIKFARAPREFIQRKLQTRRDLDLIRSSDSFNRIWYLTRNPDVARAKIDPARHYLLYGGFEGRDPNPNFSSVTYLNAHDEARRNRINPLLHFLRNSRQSGRAAILQQSEPAQPLHKCSVCKQEVVDFLPISAYYEENRRKYGYPYSFADSETMNSQHYRCPHCQANDRDRLYACYLDEQLPKYPATQEIMMLDIGPSRPLASYIRSFGNVIHHTADLLRQDVDLSIDVSDMPGVDSDSYDIIICSHVLEHVNDDRRALAEIYRVLKPRGWAILMVPINLSIDRTEEAPEVTEEAERWRRFGQFDHVRMYDKQGFAERVQHAGFILKQLGMDYFGESMFRRSGLAFQSILYIAEKTRVGSDHPAVRGIK